MVTIDIAVVKTTSCPASSLSAPICSAIVKDDTAVGAENIINTLANSISLNPIAIDIGINIEGININLPNTPINIFLIFPFNLLNSNSPPNITSARGVAIFDMSCIAVSIKNRQLYIYEKSH